MADERSPLESPDGSWWNESVNRRESIWLGISGVWALTLFGWLIGWTQVGNQNQIGPTREISTGAYQRKVNAYKERAGTREIDGEEFLVPPDDDVYIGALQWAWDGLPFVIQAGTEYEFHLGSYDVQHSFSVRHRDNLSKQVTLQVLPGYEWILEMEFDEPGTYDVVCSEFCGVGHRTMHGKFRVEG